MGATEPPKGRFSRFSGLASRSGGLVAKVMGQKVLHTLTFASADKRQRDLADLLQREGEALAHTLSGMKGAAMKLGQMLSADPDLVPPELSEALRPLQNQASALPWSTIAPLIEAAWQCPLTDVLARWEEKSVGAASIAQVHKAWLHNGQAIAIKVQYPGVKEALEADVANLKSLIKMGRILFDKARLEAWANEVKSQLLIELDFRHEAFALQRASTFFSSGDADFVGLCAPSPLWDLSNETVLVMQWVEGEKLDSALSKAPSDVVDALCARMSKAWIALCFKHGLVHSDPHPGNFLLTPPSPTSPLGEIAVLDWGATKSVPLGLRAGLQDLFRALWREDAPSLEPILRRLGFGDDAKTVEAPLLQRYLQLVLYPFLQKGTIRYGDWAPHADIRAMTLSHPSLWRLAPSADILPLLRVASGMKGLFTRANAALDLRAMLEALPDLSPETTSV